MSSSRRGFFQITVLSALSFLLVAAIMALLLDHGHPATPCAPWEKEYWAGQTEYIKFQKVSSYFWSSLCQEDAPPLLISASEGTVEPPFVAYISELHPREFSGSHRGIKTFGYMAGHTVHRERLKNLRALVFINPVYFSFAASSDAASIRLNAISNFSYILHVPTWKEKWDAFLLDSLFVGVASYFNDWSSFAGLSQIEKHLAGMQDAERPRLPEAAPEPVIDAKFDPERNIYKKMKREFTSYRSRFSSKEEPSRTLFQNSLRFVRENPEARVCFVLLPINVKNLRYFKRDGDAITRDMREMFSQVPTGNGIDLTDMNETPKLFMDPMHLSPWGVSRVMERVLASDCAAPILARGEKAHH